MAPTPKPPGQRVRRNIDQGRWKTLPAARSFERPPPLPPRRAHEAADFDPTRLESLSRAELNDLAGQRGIDAKSMRNKAAVAKAICDSLSGWLPSTIAWWEKLWESPMAAMWIEADVPQLVELAYFKDRLDRGAELSGSAFTRKTHLEDRYGLSPKARRQLQWEISRPLGDEVPEHGSEARRRRRSRVAAVDPHAVARR
jgi:hypothetical protein